MQRQRIFIDPPDNLPQEELDALTGPHIVTIARAHPYTAGYYIFCNRQDGTFELRDFIVGDLISRDCDTIDFFEMLKTESIGRLPQCQSVRGVLCHQRKTMLKNWLH
jgi:hypothetical protein